MDDGFSAELTVGSRSVDQKSSIGAGDIEKLLSSCAGPAGVARRALVRLAAIGLRSSEIAALRTDDLRDETTDPTSGRRLTIAAGSKRGLEGRSVAIEGEAAADILALAKSAGCGALFGRPPSDLWAEFGGKIPFAALRHAAAADLLAIQNPGELASLLGRTAAVDHYGAMGTHLARPLTALEDQIREELAAHGAVRDTELLVCLTADGLDEVDRVEGSVEKASLTPRMDSTVKGGTAVDLWHNHPSLRSLSAADWRKSSSENGLAACSVVSGGTLYRGVCRPSRRLQAILGAGWAQLAHDAEMAMSEAGRANDGEHVDLVIEASKLTQHFINAALQQAGLVAYAALFSEADADLLRRCDQAGVSASVIAAAADRIGV